MATRFYLNPVQEPLDSFTPDAEWDASTDIRRRMYPYRNAFEIVSEALAEVATTTWDGLLEQFVSQPLDVNQTITGTVHGAFMSRENNTAANMRSQLVIRVIAPNGTVRGTLLAASTAALSNEWIQSTSSYRNARYPVGSSGASVTSVAALAGDRIVAEVGYRAINTSATSFIGGNRYGGGVTGTDLPSNDTQTTGTTDNPWIEFSQNLTFEAPTAALSDSIAGAPDLLPAPSAETNAFSNDFDTFTNETDDPQEMDDWNGVTDTPSGWVKLDNSAGTTPALLEMRWTAGYAVFPTFFIYPDVPDNSSVMDPFPFTYDEDQPYLLNVPVGETWYVGVIPGFDGASGTWIDTNVEVIFTRIDSGASTGDIVDDIADAVDRFPSAVSTELDSETTNLSAFTTEGDDPTDIFDWTGNPIGYTGWLKLDVPTSALVTISVIEPSAHTDLVFFLYDEVPTASSIAINISDDDDPVVGSWPYLPEILLAAGTYYLCVTPYNGSDWDPFEGTQVTVRVRWEQAPTVEDFSTDAVVKRTWISPAEPNQPLIEMVGWTEDSDYGDSLTLTIPTEAEEGDLLVAVISWDAEADATLYMSSATADWSNEDNDHLSNNDQALYTYSAEYESGLSDLTVTTYRSQVGTDPTKQTTKAGVMMAFRGARSIEFRGEAKVQGTSSQGPPTPFISSFGNPRYELPSMFLGFWAGSGSGSHTWEVHPDIDDPPFGGEAMTLVAQSTYTNWASVAVGMFVHENINIDSRYMKPSSSQVHYTQVWELRGVPLNFPLQAIVQPGGAIPFNAVIAGPIGTQHDRTRYHYGVTPATNIISSQTYGAFPPGTTLQEVLEGLDDLITDLENQA